MNFNLLNVDARIEQKCCLMVIRGHLKNNVSAIDKLIAENTSNNQKTTKIKRKRIQPNDKIENYIFYQTTNKKLNLKRLCKNRSKTMDKKY